MRSARWLVGLVPAVVLVACGGNGDDAATDEGLDPDAQDEAIDDDPAVSDDGGDEADEADGATNDPADDTTDDAATDDAATDDADVDATAGTTLTVTASDVGDILVDGDGIVVYLFDQDSDGVSVCYDDCAATWPPLLAPVEAGAGVDDSLLGTGERTDGTDQVTYDGHPLYYFAADESPGDHNGQGVGDVWWVVSPEGDRITDVAADTAGRDY